MIYKTSIQYFNAILAANNNYIYNLSKNYLAKSIAEEMKKTNAIIKNIYIIIDF